MIKFTNDYSILLKKVKEELLSFQIQSDEKCVIKYAEIPWFPGGQTSMNLIFHLESNKYRLAFKTWNYLKDSDNFSIGIYSLENLSFTTEIKILNENENRYISKLISEIIEFPENLNCLNSIVLDGVDHFLIIEKENVTKEYFWKIPNDNLNLFLKIINVLKDKTS
jgi:hypothetical protein